MNFESKIEQYFLNGCETDQLQSCYKLMSEIITQQYLDWIQAKCPFYTDHGQQHIDSVINTASEMLSPLLVECYNPINKVEAFLLLCSILWHDAAMVYQRSGHAEEAKKIIEHYEKNFPNKDYARIIRDIVAAHSGKDGLKKPRLKEFVSYKNKNYPVRARFLAAVLRLSDEISENRSRISQSLINSIPIENQIFWHYANSITVSFPIPEKRELRIIFSIDSSLVSESFPASEFKNRLDNDGKIALIEYIICRLEKVNNERIYCSEAMEPTLEFKEVIAELTIVNGYERIDGLDAVEFNFRDMGMHKKGEYPNSNVYDLFFDKYKSWSPIELKKLLN